jgi:hypothetical protein
VEGNILGPLGNKHALSVPPSKGGRMRQNDAQVGGAPGGQASASSAVILCLLHTEFGAPPPPVFRQLSLLEVFDQIARSGKPDANGFPLRTFWFCQRHFAPSTEIRESAGCR